MSASDSNPQDTAAEPLPAPPAPKGNPEPNPNGHSPFPVVGIGASAGGLGALTQLLSSLPGKTGMAFLVVQHLDPHRESHLSELLARVTSMPVLEATHGLQVRPNHVYVIPPNKNMALAQGVLMLTPREEHRLHLPIDYLFRSLADDQQGRAVAVVLSGTGSDGTQGLCEIKAVGGITFAQDEKTATHSGMPHSAVQSGCVDFELPAEQIAGRLMELRGHPYLAEDPEAVVAKAEPATEDLFQTILAYVRTVTGVDFAYYRDSTIKRRIMRRMALQTQQTLAGYAQRLKDDPAEVRALSQDLLINVTSFFRDPLTFEVLKQIVLPKLEESRIPNQAFRVWVPGCSTGQEAYSIAMTLVEYFDTKPIRPPIQVFATDLDEIGLEKARTGMYPEGIAGELSAERLKRFFVREGRFYRANKTIRDMVVFARHNVTSDPPFSHLDLVSCRNVLIYFTTPLQKRVLTAFHYSLNPAGHLVLGSSETIGDYTDLFQLVDRAHRIYEKKATPTRHPLFFTSADYKSGAAFANRRVPAPVPGVPDLHREADRILVSRYAPPGVLVDENFDIIQFRGRTGAYLESPTGEPTTNILKLAREGLFLELRSALEDARKTAQSVRRESVRVLTESGTVDVHLEVIPVRVQGGAACYLVLFQDAAGTPSQKLPALPISESEAVSELRHLRQELSATREYMQSMMEQQDAANEELRSANEEIMSSNEELQSTNEELDTAKEELQSANEELTTVNDQLQRRNQELDQANSDLTNLLSSTSIPVVMVDADHRVRWFNAPTQKVVNLLPADVGRPIGDLNFGGIVPDLEKVVADVIANVKGVEREVRDRDGHWYLLRVQPYRTAEYRIEGAVILLVDIDQVRRAQDELNRRVQLIDLSLDAIIIRDEQNRVTSWNRGAEKMYGWSSAEALGRPLNELLGTAPEVWHEVDARLERAGTWDGELKHKRKDGSEIIVHSQQVLNRTARGARAAVLAIQHDVTGRQRLVEALRQADRRKDEFLALLAHELRNPLAPIRNAVELMRMAEHDPKRVLKALEVLERQVPQLSRIVDDLIDVSRIVERKIELRKESVSISSVVNMAIETCRSMIEERKQDLSADVTSEVLYIDADPVRISQVLVNLLTNASKYTNPGGKIWLSATSDRPTQVEIRVRDTGIGIRPDLLPHVFDMFTQGTRAPEHGRGGLGVGLTLVRSLVHMHGGEVEARSEGAGKGSEFIVRLPRSKEPTTRPAEGRSHPEKPAIKPLRIVVVDDNEDQLESLAMLLDVRGHQVRLAHDGPEALNICSEFRPDVALVDIGLPGMNGYEVARRLREGERGREMLIIAQTGWGQDNDRKRSQDAGFDYHLVKPVGIEALEPILRRAGQEKAG